MSKIEIEERRERIRKLYLTTEKSTQEMAEEVNATAQVVANDIRVLKQQGKLDRGRRVKLSQLKKAQEKMAKKPGNITKVVGDQNTKSPETQKEIQKIETKSALIRKLCDDFYGQEGTKKIFSQYISDCKSRCKRGILQEDEVKLVENIAMLTQEYKNIICYLEICLRLKKYNEAIKFANDQMMNNETLTTEERNKIREMRKKIKEIMEKQIAITALENGLGVESARKQSGLPETVVIQLNHQLLQKKAQEEKKEEEPNI